MCLIVNSSKHAAFFFYLNVFKLRFFRVFVAFLIKSSFFLLLLNPLLPTSNMWVALACSAYMVIIGDLMGEPSGCCMRGGSQRSDVIFRGSSRQQHNTAQHNTAQCNPAQRRAAGRENEKEKNEKRGGID